MIDRYDQLDPIEFSLRELADAERADLFRQTRVDARSLLRNADGHIDLVDASAYQLNCNAITR